MTGKKVTIQEKNRQRKAAKKIKTKSFLQVETLTENSTISLTSTQ